MNTRMRVVVLGLVASAASVGCGVAVRPGDGGAGEGGGVAPQRDGGVAPTRDGGGPVTPPVDGGIAPVTPDGGVVRDGSVVPPPPRDGGPMPMGTGTLVGRWRVTAIEFTAMGGRRVRITDVNSSLDVLNTYRVNGVVDIAPGTIAFSWGFLTNDHFTVQSPDVEIDRAFSGSASYYRGVLDDRAGTFAASGPFTVAFARNADGTISLDDATSGWRTTYTRVEPAAAPVRTALDQEGLVVLHRPMDSDPFAHPRVALVWDAPGGAYVESHGVALRFGIDGAPYRFNVSGPPPAAAASSVFGATVAVAYLVVYDDVNDNARFDHPFLGSFEGRDVLRGVSPVALAYRGAGAVTPAFDASPLHLVREGYQFVHLAREFADRPVTLVPYDMTREVPPDVPVSDTVMRRRLLDVIP